ncbi:MAG: hypothetical protein WAN61_02410 [Minisyncoccia bacterium]
MVGIAQTNGAPEKTLSKEEQKIEAKKNIDLAKLRAQIEIAQEKRKLEETEQSAGGIGIAHNNKATITGTEREQTENIYDAKGNIIGERKVKESSKDMMKHEEKMKKNHQQEVIFANPSERIVEDAGVLRGVGISQQERDRMALKKIEEERKEDAKHWGGR